LGFSLLDLEGAFSLRFVRVEGIHQSHGDIDPFRVRVPVQFSFVPFGNDACDAGGLLNLWKVTRNLVMARTLPAPAAVLKLIKQTAY